MYCTSAVCSYSGLISCAPPLFYFYVYIQPWVFMLFSRPFHLHMVFLDKSSLTLDNNLPLSVACDHRWWWLMIWQPEQKSSSESSVKWWLNCSGCRNVSHHHQQSLSRPHSPRWSHSTLSHHHHHQFFSRLHSPRWSHSTVTPGFTPFTLSITYLLGTEYRLGVSMFLTGILSLGVLHPLSSPSAFTLLSLADTKLGGAGKSPMRVDCIGWGFTTGILSTGSPCSFLRSLSSSSCTNFCSFFFCSSAFKTSSCFLLSSSSAFCIEKTKTSINIKIVLESSVICATHIKWPLPASHSVVPFHATTPMITVAALCTQEEFNTSHPWY